MNNKKISKGFISKILLVLMVLNSFGSVSFAAENKKPAVTGKPLVVMMEFQDYKFSDIDDKEGNSRIRGVKGKDFTKEYVNDWLFAENTYTSVDLKGVKREVISIRQSLSQMTNGTYDFNGQVAGPYTAKHNARHYGIGEQESTRLLIEEAIEAASKDPNINLADFDVETRIRDTVTNETHITYNKPDGQVDTVIVIHPGIGNEMGGGSLWNKLKNEETGKPYYEEFAIHPFRRGFTWYGGSWDLKEYKTEDEKGKEWRFDDFLIVAQDGASDIVMHEFGHILGLPDLYSSATRDTPAQYWDIMGGSYTGEYIPGDGPIAYGGYSRYYLHEAFKKGNASDVNWANLEEFNLEDINGQEIDLNRSSEKNGMTDLVKINLPESEEIIAKPLNGNTAFFTGQGDNLDNSMLVKDIDLLEFEEAKLKFHAWYDIDPGFDFVTLRVHEAGKEEWEVIEGNITTDQVADWVMENETEEEIKLRNPGHGITGKSKGWIDAEFNLSKYVGKKIDLEFYFHTDTNTPEKGMYFDNINIFGKTKPEEVEEVEEPEEVEEIEDDDIYLNEKDIEFVLEGQNYFSFELEEDTEVNIQLNYKDAENLTWAIYGPDNNALAYPLNSTKEMSQGKFNLPKGKHQITVYGSTDPKAGKFDLLIEKAPVIEDEDNNTVDPIVVEEGWEEVLDLKAENAKERGMDLGDFEYSDGISRTERYYLIEWRKGELGKLDGGHEKLNNWNNLNYEPGMLIWYINKAYDNQDVREHPGYLEIGVVDADQTPMEYIYNGEYMKDSRADFMMHDATFSLKPEKEFRHVWDNGSITHDRDNFMIPDFDDARDYSNSKGNKEAGLILDELGLKVMVLEEKADRTGGRIKLINKNNAGTMVNNETNLKLNVSTAELVNNKEIIVEANNNGSLDDLGEKAYVNYINKETGEHLNTTLTFDGKVYRSELDFSKEIEDGDYEIGYIILEDKEGNSKAIYNSKYHDGYGVDLSGSDVSLEISERIRIDSLEVKDKNGTKTDTFEKGNIVNVETVMSNIQKLDDATVVIEVLDGEGVPYVLKTSKYKANKLNTLGFSTYEAKEGTNTINIYVWNNLKDKEAAAEKMTYEFELK